VLGGSIKFTDTIPASLAVSEEDMRQRLLEYQAIFDNASLGIIFTLNRTFRHCNPRFSEMYGWPSNELIGMPTWTVYPSHESFAALSKIAAPILGSGGRLDTELQMKRRDGSLFWCRMLGRAIDPADHGKGTIFIVEDIAERKSAEQALMRVHEELERRVQERTAELAMANARLHAEIQERKLAEKQIRYMANHDALTGLPNRRLMEDRLEQAIETARRQACQAAVLFIDLDRFKPINDRYGHRIGDLLLQAVAQRLRSLLRAVDTVSRIGGDEFILVLPHMQSDSAAAEAAQRVLAALARPYQVEGLELSVAPSIGVSIFPLHGQDAGTLLSCADAAMYHAKKAGRANVQLFAEIMKG
jgi:diguanylate cyclase (GGDEF)-like protein/PAS domain S-box-containing protein